MKFFFYADNLNPSQLKRRAPEHKFLFTAYRPDHSIQFCRWSTQWRCGLASVIPSPGEKVWGAVFEITDEDLKILDEFEGDVPQGAYRHLPVTVITEEGEKLLVSGSGRGGKLSEQSLSVREQAAFKGVRARRGQEIPFKLKPLAIAVITDS